MAEIETEVTDTAVADAPDTPADDIEELLRQFESGTQPQTTEQISDAAAERDRAFAENLRAHTENLALDSKRQELQSYERALQMEINVKDAMAAFAEIRGNLPAEMFDDRMIDAWITSRGASDPTIRAAWENRAADPKTYQRVLNKLAGEFGNRFRAYRREEEVDHEAVAQAVRGASTRVPPEPPPDFSRMTDRELRQYTRDNYGFE